MKRLLGLVVMVFGLCVPAHAQAGMAIGPGSSTGGGSFSGGGGLGGGTSVSLPLPTVPPAHFAMAEYRGTYADFVPSAYVTYEQAIAKGHAALAKPMSIAETAAENKGAPRTRAKFALVQDDSGNAIIATR